MRAYAYFSKNDFESCFLHRRPAYCFDENEMVRMKESVQPSLYISRVFLIDGDEGNFVDVLQDILKFTCHMRVLWSLYRDFVRFIVQFFDNSLSNSLIKYT